MAETITNVKLVLIDNPNPTWAELSSAMLELPTHKMGFPKTISGYEQACSEMLKYCLENAPTAEPILQLGAMARCTLGRIQVLMIRS